MSSRRKPYSEHVREARRLLQDARLLIVGGESRPQSIRNLEEAFGCMVRHETPGPHSSLSRLGPAVASSTAVLLLIRWSSHHHGQQLKAMCRQAGCPLVLLPAGYGVEQVADAVLKQASHCLN